MGSSRGAWLLALLAFLTACAPAGTTAGIGAGTPAACPAYPAVLRAASTSAADPAQALPAIMQDVAAGPGELGYGRPGGQPAVLRLLSVTQPQLAGGRLFLTLRQGGDTEVVAVSTAGCRRLTVGTLVSAAVDGSAAVVRDGAGAYRLVDGTGRVRDRLPAATLLWSGDGRLVAQAGTSDLSVYGAAGPVRRLTVQGQLASPLGRSQVVLTTTSATVALDLDTGAVTRLGSFRLFLAAGSPDGRWVAGVDYESGALEAYDVPGRRLAMLPDLGRVASLRWASNGWLAVNGPYGGFVLREGDWRSTDLGPYNLVSWASQPS